MVKCNLFNKIKKKFNKEKDLGLYDLIVKHFGESSESENLYYFINEETHRLSNNYINDVPLLKGDLIPTYNRLFFNLYFNISDIFKEKPVFDDKKISNYKILRKLIGTGDLSKNVPLNIINLGYKFEEIYNSKTIPKSKKHKKPYIDNVKLISFFNIITYHVLTDLSDLTIKNEECDYIN